MCVPVHLHTLRIEKNDIFRQNHVMFVILMDIPRPNM